MSIEEGRNERDLRAVQEHERVLLRDANENLLLEMAERKRLAEKLKEHSAQLEDQVAERTRALQDTNRKLEQEILEHKRAERLLQESEELYADLYDNAPDMYVSVDAQTARVLQCNQTLAEKLGFSKEEIIDRPVFNLYHPDSLPAAERVFRTFVETGRILDEELQLRKKSGHRIDVSLNVSAVRDESGKVLHSRSCWRDISDRKRLEAQIRQDEKLASLGTVAGGVAHNFNNLLMAILGFQDMAMIDLDPASQTCRNVRQAYDLSLRASEVASKMLSYTGIAYFIAKPMDLSGYIRELIPELQESMPAEALLELELDETLPAVASDPAPLKQVLRNLATNAWEALGETRGVIRVTTGSMHCSRERLRKTYLQENLPEGDYVYLEVSDPGQGIDPGNMDKIFDPFFTTKIAGRGLGLASLLGIVRAHRGAVEVRSRPGERTRFRVLLPAAGPGDAAEA